MYTPPVGNVSVITTSSVTDHSRMRKMLSHAFSARALAEQESIVQDTITEFIVQVGREAEKGPWVNMVPWFNYLTFDIIGELAFGESFHCMAEGMHFLFLFLPIFAMLQHLTSYSLVWASRTCHRMGLRCIGAYETQRPRVVCSQLPDLE